MLAQRYHVHIRDVSGDVNKLDFYQDCDLHIGYRVHAHLYFISQRTPSILINEDGRGLGMGVSLGLPVFDVNEKDLIDRIQKQLKVYLDEQFESFNTTFSFIDSTFEVMKEFLFSIKKN